MGARDINIALIATWFRPLIVTGIIFLFTFTLLVPDEHQEERDQSIMSSVAPVLATSAMMLVESVPIVHDNIYLVSRWTGFTFCFYTMYAHLWSKVHWALWSNPALILLSIVVVAVSFLIHKAYGQNTRLRMALPQLQIGFITLILMVPNTSAVMHKLKAWEVILRVAVFVVTSWFNLVALMISDTDVNVHRFFNKFWWVLVVHRMLIPAVAVVWMASIMHVTKRFSAPQRDTPTTDQEMQSLLQGGDRSLSPSPDDIERQSTPPASVPPTPRPKQKRATTMFTTHEAGVQLVPHVGASAVNPAEVGHAKPPPGHTRRRMLRNQWRPTPTTNATGSNTHDQALRLQQLASGVEAVS